MSAFEDVVEAWGFKITGDKPAVLSPAGIAPDGSIVYSDAESFRDLIGAEPELGNPSVNGWILSSSSAGVRSWVAPNTHSHVIADVTGLQSALDARMATASYSDLVAIEALAGTSGLLRKTAANTWSLDTASYALSSAIPVASSTTPAALGTAAVGTGTTWARADHVHTMPTAAQVGAAASGHNHTLDSLSNVTITSNVSGEILKWNGTSWVNSTLSEAGIQPAGSYASATHSHAISDVANLQTALDGKEAVLGNPATNGYVLSSTTAGVRSWVPLPTIPVTSVFGRTGAVVAASGDYTTAQVAESGNLYFTEARVRATPLTGYAVGSNTALAATDTILGAFGKIQSQINSRPGTVISVGLTAPANMTASGSPVTGSGTLALAWNGSSANLVRADGSLIAASSFQSALGYTPVNKAGDTGIGALSMSALTLTGQDGTSARPAIVSTTGAVQRDNLGSLMQWSGTYVAVRNPSRTTGSFYEFWDSAAGWADISCGTVRFNSLSANTFPVIDANKVLTSQDASTFLSTVGAAASSHTHAGMTTGSGATGQIARWTGSSAQSGDNGFRSIQTDGITWRFLLDGSASTTTNTEMVLCGRNASGGQADLSWSDGFYNPGVPTRRMTARWNSSADQLEFFSSDDTGASRANRLILPRSSSVPVNINGGLAVTGMSVASEGIVSRRALGLSIGGASRCDLVNSDETWGASSWIDSGGNLRIAFLQGDATWTDRFKFGRDGSYTQLTAAGSTSRMAYFNPAGVLSATTDAAAARTLIDAAPTSHSHTVSQLSNLGANWPNLLTASKPTTLSGYGITDAQPLDSDLTAIAALSTQAFGRSLLTQADAAAARTLIDAAPTSHSHTVANLSNLGANWSGLLTSAKPTTLSGYGITDAQAALGYTPVNKAGDTMTGGLTVPHLKSASSWVLGGTYAGIASLAIGASGALPGSVDTSDYRALFSAQSLRLKNGAEGGAIGSIGITSNNTIVLECRTTGVEGPEMASSFSCDPDKYVKARGLGFLFNDAQVLSSRKTGWGAPTGTATRSTFATSTVTLPQLAERVKALLDDLISHGLIGA